MLCVTRNEFVHNWWPAWQRAEVTRDLYVFWAGWQFHWVHRTNVRV